ISLADGSKLTVKQHFYWYTDGYAVETLRDAAGNTLNLRGDLPVIGTDAADSLLGSSGAETLVGGAGDDTLTGNGGEDTYLVIRGSGQDIVNNVGQFSAADKVVFGADVTTDQLWFQQAGDDLKVSIIGTADVVTVAGWYQSSNNHVAQFNTAGGSTLSDAVVQNLVNAMAGFSPPPVGQTTLTADQHQQLDTVIAANWKAA
ncbi:MAG: calcium-binding protein, partial [Bacteroidota bacterium]